MPNHSTSEQAEPVIGQAVALIDATFATVDVKAGRDSLLRRVNAGEKVPVVIRGVIDGPWSSDDGVSREFALLISSMGEAP